jgi:hypothetical protein
MGQKTRGATVAPKLKSLDPHGLQLQAILKYMTCAPHPLPTTKDCDEMADQEREKPALGAKPKTPQ